MGGIDKFIKNKDIYAKDIDVNLGVLENVLSSKILENFKKNPLNIQAICYSLDMTESVLDHILDDENDTLKIELLLKVVLALGYKINLSIEDNINDK